MPLKILARPLRCIALALVLLAPATPAAAQTYPSRPIRIVVPLPPGANGDLMPRILAQHLSANLGQPVVIENRPGAAQNLGAEIVYRVGARRLHAVRHAAGAAGDQPELLSQARLRSDAVRAGHHHGEAALHPGGASQGAGDDVCGVHRLRRANPDKLNDASPSTGSGPHLTSEMLKLAAGIKMTRVPYSGMAPALNDLLAGHVDMMFDNLGNSLPLVQEGKLKGLAVSSDKRTRRAARRAGDRGDLSRGAGDELVCHRRAAQDAAGDRQRSCRRLSPRFCATPEVEKRWRDMTLTPVGGTPEEIAAFFKVETERWRKVIVSGNIKPD